MSLRDVAVAADLVVAELADYAPPKHPCPKCGAETKVHAIGLILKTTMSRICSRESCRYVVTLA